MPVYQFAIAGILVFIGICSSLLLIVRLLLPRHDYRDETRADFPDFDSHLEPLSIGVELERQVQINSKRTQNLELHRRRVHRRERATMARRGGER